MRTVRSLRSRERAVIQNVALYQRNGRSNRSKPIRSGKSRDSRKAINRPLFGTCELCSRRSGSRERQGLEKPNTMTTSNRACDTVQDVSIREAITVGKGTNMVTGRL